MNIMPAFQAILYTISTALLYPVIVVLILLSLWIVLQLGGYFAEWLTRRKMRNTIEEAMDAISAQKNLPEALKGELPGCVALYGQELATLLQQEECFCREKVESLHQQAEAQLFKEVDRMGLVVRIGPSLGLMGTLIPLGPGLAGLTEGNMAQLSSSLILAFTTTVVGLAIGIVAYIFSVVREHWAMDDLRRINLITEAMTKDIAKDGAV